MSGVYPIASLVRCAQNLGHYGDLPSRPGELHPEPLTEPDVSLSTYPARATQ